MQKNLLTIAGVAGAVIVGLVLLWYGSDVYLRKNEPKDQIEAALPGVRLAPAITDTSVVAPKVSRKLVFPDYMPRDFRKQITAAVDTLADNIEKDPTDINNWLDLALQYKQINDIEGAREVWVYLTKAAPKHALSFYNLGYLHHISLKEYPMAEEYFTQAIAIDPSQELYYLGFHELYRYSYKKDTTKAVDTLKQGMRALPDSINLTLTLASYYRDEKQDKKSAVQYFTQARDMAKKTGNTDLVKNLDAQIAALK